MIGRISGRLIENSPPFLLVDVNGVGYELEVPLTVLGDLPAAGEPCTFYTHFVVREDAQLLYGFAGRQDRELFRLLLKVNGVGPKLAIAILSHMSVSEFVGCVQEDNVTRLTKMPGIGKKTAERLLIEMRDRITGWRGGSDAAAPATDNRVQSKVPVEEAEAALLALGYRPQEASKAVQSVATEGMGRDELIRQALRSMVKK